MCLGVAAMSYLSSTNRCVKLKLQIRAGEHLVLWRIQDQTPADRKDQAKEDPSTKYLQILESEKGLCCFPCSFFLSFTIGGVVVGQVEGGWMGLVGGS